MAPKCACDGCHTVFNRLSKGTAIRLPSSSVFCPKSGVKEVQQGSGKHRSTSSPWGSHRWTVPVTTSDGSDTDKLGRDFGVLRRHRTLQPKEAILTRLRHLCIGRKSNVLVRRGVGQQLGVLRSCDTGPEKLCEFSSFAIGLDHARGCGRHHAASH